MTRKDWLLFGCVAAFIALFPVVASRFGAVSHYTDVMIFAGIFALVNLGLGLLMGQAGQISLAQAAFFGIGAYASGILTQKFGWNPWLAMPVGAAVSGAVALSIGIPALRLKGHYLAMATLGFGVIVHIVITEEVALTGGPSGLTDIPGLSVFGHAVKGEFAWYAVVWVFVLSALLFSLNLIRSRVGRALSAIHEEEGAAEAMGVPTARLKVQVFVLSAVFAALAGSLYCHYVTFLDPNPFNLMWSIRFLLMVMVGGIGSLWGVVLGSVLMTFVGNEWLQVFADFEILIYGAILLTVALFLPRGLVSIRLRGASR